MAKLMCTDYVYLCVYVLPRGSPWYRCVVLLLDWLASQSKEIPLLWGGLNTRAHGPYARHGNIYNFQLLKFQLAAPHRGSRAIKVNASWPFTANRKLGLKWHLIIP